jgi:D-alanine transaminase
MSRIAYVNGRYLPHSEARVHIEDRGYQFSDGVYEVCEVHEGRLVDSTRHLARLERSLGELRIREPMTRAALTHVMRETVRRNRVRNGLVYVQVTRGVAPRDHMFPPPDVPPSLVVTARSIDPRKGAAMAERGIEVITVPENRWERVDIKTVSLLPNVLARQIAAEKGAAEAWFVDAGGHVTEGSSTNAWIVDDEGNLITRSADNGILRGITRSVVVDLIAREGGRLIERSFTVEEAVNAREAFVTSATKLLTPVVRIDGRTIGDGRPGPLTLRLRQLYHSQAAFA